MTNSKSIFDTKVFWEEYLELKEITRDEYMQAIRVYELLYGVRLDIPSNRQYPDVTRKEPNQNRQQYVA